MPTSPSRCIGINQGDADHVEVYSRLVTQETKGQGMIDATFTQPVLPSGLVAKTVVEDMFFHRP